MNIGEGLGVDKTIIGTKILDMTNVSTAKVGSLTIMDASVNKQYMSMKNGEVIIGNNNGSPSNVISVQNENADDRTSSGITITAVGGVNVSSQQHVEVEKIVLDEGKLHFRESGSATYMKPRMKAGLSIVSTHGHVRIENITFSKNNISGLSSLLISNSIENSNTVKQHKLLAVRGADKSNHFSVESDGKLHAPKIAGGVQIYGSNKDSDVLKLNDSVSSVRRSSKIFQVNSISTYIENPMSLDVPNMTGGKGFESFLLL